MKASKKILSIAMILFIVFPNLTCYSLEPISSISNSNSRSPIKAGVLLYSFDYLYTKMIRQDLENIQKENSNKVQFTFFDGKGNPDVQAQIMNELIDYDFDLLIFNVGQKRKDLLDNIFFKIKQKNIPLIFLYSTIPESTSIKDYSKFAFINIDFKESSIVQGKLIVDTWNSTKTSMDKNGDNILQYILLKGRPDSVLANTRAKYPILTINEAGIPTQELALLSANWDKDIAKNSISSSFLKYGNNIDAIIANDDTMAIGAIEALQQYGYNKGDSSKYIPVFGADGSPEAKHLIKEGVMAGTVAQETEPLAQAVFIVGMNLVSGKNPIDSTDYKISNKEIIVPIKYESIV